ncbi:hypothetical protein [Labrys miyagiensis]|uniref:ATP dependent DNA ligase n=1 Tax=Labrys miyagiensis TaxID=346912 RepID=UPI003D66A4A2
MLLADAPSYRAGFTCRTAADLKKQPRPLVVNKPPAAHHDPDVLWIEPKLIMEIEFHSWMDDQKLGHALLKGCERRRTRQLPRRVAATLFAAVISPA